MVQTTLKPAHNKKILCCMKILCDMLTFITEFSGSAHNTHYCLASVTSHIMKLDLLFILYHLTHVTADIGL